MLPVAIVKVVQIAAGIVVGNVASDTLDKVVDKVKEVIEAKKEA